MLLSCLLICVILWSDLSSGVCAGSYRRPNVVVILTDDLDIAIGGLVCGFNELVLFVYL